MNQTYLDLCKMKALVMAGWCQGQSETSDGKVCLYGAANKAVADEKDDRNERMSNLYVALGLRSMVDWNDKPGRTQADVIALIDRAAQEAAQQ